MKQHPTASHSLQFPDKPVGRLYISDDFAGERFLSEAYGTVIVPTGVQLKLHVYAQAVADLECLSYLQQDTFHTISVGGTAITDLQALPLAHFTGVECFSFEHTPLEGSFLKRFKDFNSLKVLNGWWSRLRDVNLSALATFPALESIDFSRTPITDKGARELAACTNLHTVILLDTKTTDATVKALAGLSKLRVLSVGSAK